MSSAETGARFAAEPMLLGSTSWAGNRVHRVTRGKHRYYSPCGAVLRHVFSAAPAEQYYPLCARCFTADERHAVMLEELGRS